MFFFFTTALINLKKKKGHGTNIITGMSIGLISTAIPVVMVSVAVILSYWLGKTSGLPIRNAGLYGTGVATMVPLF